MAPCGPLNQFPAGSRVRIEQLCECSRARGRLCAMGLTPGTVVEICSGCGGPCYLKVRGARLTLGHGLAETSWPGPWTPNPTASSPPDFLSRHFPPAPRDGRQDGPRPSGRPSPLRVHTPCSRAGWV
jgi:ferrous iron transport protein A